MFSTPRLPQHLQLHALRCVLWTGNCRGACRWQLAILVPLAYHTPAAVVYISHNHTYQYEYHAPVYPARYPGTRYDTAAASVAYSIVEW